MAIKPEVPDLITEAQPLGEYCAFDATTSFGAKLGGNRSADVAPHPIEYVALILLVTAVSWFSIPHFLAFNYAAKIQSGKDQLKHLYVQTKMYRDVHQEWPPAREGLEAQSWDELGWIKPHGRTLYRLATNGKGGATAVSAGTDGSLEGVQIHYTDPDPDGFECLMYVITDHTGAVRREPFMTESN